MNQTPLNSYDPYFFIAIYRHRKPPVATPSRSLSLERRHQKSLRSVFCCWVERSTKVLLDEVVVPKRVQNKKEVQNVQHIHLETTILCQFAIIFSRPFPVIRLKKNLPFNININVVSTRFFHQETAQHLSCQASSSACLGGGKTVWVFLRFGRCLDLFLRGPGVREVIWNKKHESSRW